MRWTSGRAVIAGVVCLALAATACSSTKQHQATKGNVDAVGTTVPGGADEAGETTTTLAGALGRAAAKGGGAKGGTVDGRAAPGAPASTTGVCKGGVQVGFSYAKDIGAAAAMAGITNVGDISGDTQKAAIQEVVDEVNKVGGLNECAIEPVYFGFTVASGDYVVESQQECQMFTQDNHVVAAIPAAWEDYTLIQCLADKNIPVVWAVNINTYVDNPNTFDHYPGLVYMPWAITAERMGSFMDRLKEARYFDPGTKLGVILFPDSAGGAQSKLWKNNWKPKLQAMGVNVAAEYTYKVTPRNEQQGAQQGAQESSSAVLQFKAAHVDHVLFMPGGAPAFLFVPAAKSQDFHPRYALFSSSYPGLAATYGDEMKGAVGIGWIQSMDEVPDDQIVHTAGRQRCDQALKTNPGLANGGSYLMCDGLYMLQKALVGARDTKAASIRAGVDKLGTSFVSAASLGPAFLASGHYDGATRARMLTYDTANQTFRYSGPDFPVP